MAAQFDFISATDKPALLAINNPEWLDAAKASLTELGYKVQDIENHAQFPSRFAEVPYQIVVIDETFSGTAPAENFTLQSLQRMPMNQRRHTAVVLLTSTFETLNPLHAFQQSVHAVVNYSEIALLGQIVQKVAADNDLFLHTLRETQKRIAQNV